MYRDDHEAARARLDALLRRQERAAAQIRKRLDASPRCACSWRPWVAPACDARRRRDDDDVLDERRLHETGDRATLLLRELPALVAAAGVAEARAAELETELSPRVHAVPRPPGARRGVPSPVALPLAPAPRRVPLRYVIGVVAAR